MDKIQKAYTVSIKGLNSIIFNVMKRELDEEKRKLKKNELEEWELKNWRRKAEFNDKGDVIIPERWINSLLISACKKTRIVPYFENKKNATYTDYVSSFMILNIGKPLGKEKDLKEYGCYMSSQGKSQMGGKVWRIRPMVSNWEGTFKIIDPAGRMRISELETLFSYGGMFIGLGDSRKMNLGRFEVVKILEVKNE